MSFFKHITDIQFPTPPKGTEVVLKERVCLFSLDVKKWSGLETKVQHRESIRRMDKCEIMTGRECDGVARQSVKSSYTFRMICTG